MTEDRRLQQEVLDELGWEPSMVVAEIVWSAPGTTAVANNIIVT